MVPSSFLRIAHVSTFPPLRCGIAFFASDLIAALHDVHNSKYALHYGKDIPPNTRAHADVTSPRDLVMLAKLISQSDCDVVGLQHEFGIWGGTDGENLLPFLDNLTKPVLSILHTTFGPGVRTHVQSDLLRTLVDRSARVVLLTEESRRTIETLAGRRLPHAAVVPHGVPRYSYRAPPAASSRGGRRTLRLITPGFFREDKGFEVVLEAVQRLRLKGWDLTYLIAGEAQGQFSGQTAYRRKIQLLIRKLKLGGSAHCDIRFLSVAEQIEAIHDCHFGVFAYQEPSQSSSGTIPLVMSAGRPVICTPFEYARSKSEEGFPTILAKGFDAEDVADAIETAWSSAHHSDLAAKAYASTSDWTWSSVGARFGEEFRRAVPNLMSPPCGSASV